MENLETFLEACISSGKYVKSEDSLGLPQKSILKIEDTLARHCDSKAKTNIREIVKNSGLINCPYCGNVWDLKEVWDFKEVCKCGASI